MLTQGPLQHTVESFWQMVWDENCNTIVMLTALAENNRTLCHQFWPSDGLLTYGNFEVNFFYLRSIYFTLVLTNQVMHLLPSSIVVHVVYMCM